MLCNNFNDKERQVGFEIEYAGIPLDIVAETIMHLFGGDLEKINNTIETVKNTDLGDFKLELDSIPLQKIAENNQTLKSSEALYEQTQYQLGKTVNDMGAKIVPYEIVCPPIKISQIPALQTLCDQLYDQGAKGTKSSVLYAFGLHINPEAARLDTQYILRHIQSFLLLSAWLKKTHDVDISRRLTSFIDPFPSSYFEHILNKDYEVDQSTLIRDYHQHNPTRNRALDMLPLFAYLDEKLVRNLYGEEEKINKRPTFHYRLPNSEIGQPDWSINKEWERWLQLEKIANDQSLLNGLLEKWQTHQQKLIASESSWIAEVDQFILTAND